MLLRRKELVSNHIGDVLLIEDSSYYLILCVLQECHRIFDSHESDFVKLVEKEVDGSVGISLVLHGCIIYTFLAIIRLFFN